jgi:hypothetical protein
LSSRSFEEVAVNVVPLNRLRDAHARLDQLLGAALRARAPDPAEVKALKKRKLALKDRIAALEAKRPTAH